MHLLKNTITTVKNISPILLKQKEIFNKLIVEKRDEILKLSRTINYDDLKNHFKSKNSLSLLKKDKGW